jgi:hypothetical protein
VWIFFIFRFSKIRISPTDIVSSIFPLWCRLSSGPRRYVATPCHAFFPWRQDELTVFVSSSGNASSYRLPSWAKTEALNPHHRRRPPSPDSSTLILHWYKKIISTLITIHITELCLHFASFLATTPHHQSFTYCRRFLSSLFHTHRPFAQWHQWWRTSRSSFSFQISYQHVNSRKKYFKISHHHVWLSISTMHIYIHALIVKRNQRYFMPNSIYSS